MPPKKAASTAKTPSRASGRAVSAVSAPAPKPAMKRKAAEAVEDVVKAPSKRAKTKDTGNDPQFISQPTRSVASKRKADEVIENAPRASKRVKANQDTKAAKGAADAAPAKALQSTRAKKPAQKSAAPAKQSAAKKAAPPAKGAAAPKKTATAAKTPTNRVVKKATGAKRGAPAKAEPVSISHHCILKIADIF
jgi:hypothetical protein